MYSVWSWWDDDHSINAYTHFIANVSARIFRISAHCWWYSSRPSENVTNCDTCSTWKDVSRKQNIALFISLQIIYKKKMANGLEIDMGKTINEKWLTSFSSRLYIPSWAKCNDSANFSSAPRISSSVIWDPFWLAVSFWFFVCFMVTYFVLFFFFFLANN